MEFLKALFEAGALTWEQFEKAVTDKGYKLADLSTGNYVSKAKYDDELKQKDTTITDLTGQIKSRDKDLTALQTQLANVDTDNATKVADLTTQLEKLKGDYATQHSDYEKRLAAQSYEFAVTEYANSQKFSSNAAKRDFIKQMIAENLKMKDKQILGADDFATKYKETDPDAFVSEPALEPPAPGPTPEPNKPTFVQPTPPQPALESNPFNFNFSGI